MPATTKLSLERIDQIALITGGALLDADFLVQLDDCCAAVPDDARVVVLHPEATVWGGFVGPTDVGDLFAAVAALPMPTIAVLEGSVVGGGLELALAADLRVAAADCRLGLDALGGVAGGFPRAGGLQRLSRAVGRSRAAQLLLLDEQIDAAAALDWGLVNVVAADAAAASLELARTIAARGPIAARYAKDAIRHGLEMPLAQAMQYETELTILLQSTADRAEGVEAFVGKRQPAFRGS